MSNLAQISEALQKGKAKEVKDLVQKAVNDKVPVSDILNQGLLAGMDVIGEKFKNNEVYVPEVLIAARAMNSGMEILKPLLESSGSKSLGKAVIGTVKGDLHDIGKNLVGLMMKGKGIDVIDLGVDVSAQQYVDTFKKENCNIIGCSAMLTTTMGVMKEVVDLLVKEGIRDKAIVMVGGSPISDTYCKTIGADIYTPDAASAADAAKKALGG